MRQFSVILALGALSALFCAADSDVPTLQPGSPMPPFELPGVDGQLHHSADWSTSKALVVVFTCNHCPTAELYEDRIKAIAADYASKGVTVVAIQPNNPNAIRLDELGYTDLSDSFPEMKIRAQYRHFNFPYLYDGDTQKVARQFGPSATPHVFLFDESRHLRYQGRVDDSPREAMVKRRDLREALNSVLAGRPVMVSKTPSMGCSTKWIYKEAGRNEEAEKFAKEPVTLHDASAEDLTKLAHNASGRATLVSFWATWCGPCVNEMEGLVTTWRMYRKRPLDLVTVSTNYPDEKKGALAKLEEYHVSARNLIFGTTDNYGLMKAFDPTWDAAVPYTALLGPDGKVLWKYQGEMDTLTLRRRILASLPDDDYVGQRAYWNIGGL